MNADDRLVDVGDAIAQHGDRGAHLSWRGVAHGVGDVHRACAGLDGSFDHLAQEVVFGAHRVFRRELDIIAIRGSQFHAFHGALNDLLARHLEFVFAMDRASRQKHVNAGMLGDLQGFPARLMSFSLHRARPHTVMW